MFNRLMIFFTIVIVLLTINSNYHFHIDDHHEHYHAGVDIHEITAQQLNFHYSEHTEYQENTGIISSILILLILFISIAFFLLLKKRKIQSVPIRSFSKLTYIDPPPLLIRYIFFHAPPLHHS